MTGTMNPKISCRHCAAVYDPPGPRFCGRCGGDLHPSGGSSLSSLGGAAEAAGSSGGDGAAGAADEEGGHDPLLGRVVGGRYRVMDRIGSGGMGVVYRVQHTSMGKIAAMKMLHPTLSGDREVAKRFRTEARAVSLLTHPNTVQVFDFGEADGILYMVMELVKGDDLGTILEREGQRSWPRCAQLLTQICDALGEAHEAGIVHRDLKPENILVSRARDGHEVVKVLDFGLAKLREREEMSRITGRGSVIGTPYYMSPEQIRGDEMDARSDIYSLGAMAYQMVTGQHPFEGPTPVAVLTAHLTERPAPMQKARPDLVIDAAVEDVVSRCLSRDPGDRYATVDDLRAAIAESVKLSREAARRRGPGLTPSGVSAIPSAVNDADRSGATSWRDEPSLTSPTPKLLREDFDRYERSLRLRRTLWMITMSVVLLVAAGAGAFFVTRPEGGQPVDEEVEPNDSAAQANPIGMGKAVRGHIGKRSSIENSDRDFFSFEVRGDPSVLRLELSGVPGMDLHLGVFDGAGAELATHDTGGPGAGEVIPNLRVDPGKYYVSVREEWVSGRMASEDLEHWYTLRATWRAISGDEETEPDDSPALALPIALGRPVTGYLGKANDVDYFYPRGSPGGELSGTLSGIAGVEEQLIVIPPGVSPVDPPARTPGALVFDKGGPGQGEIFDHVKWPAGGAAPLIVVTRKDRLDKDDGHRAAVLGTDVPYSLFVDHSGKPAGARPAPH